MLEIGPSCLFYLPLQLTLWFCAYRRIFLLLSKVLYLVILFWRYVDLSESDLLHAPLDKVLQARRGSSFRCACIHLVCGRSRVRWSCPAAFFRRDLSWNTIYGRSFPTADSVTDERNRLSARHDQTNISQPTDQVLQ